MKDLIKRIIIRNINEVKELRDTMTGKSSKAKYNFTIGVLQNLIIDIDEIT